MSQTTRAADPVLVTIRRPMNGHDTVTVEVCDTNETRHLVEYEGADLKRTLAALPADTRVPVRMEPIGTRANVWRAVDLSAEPDRSVATEPRVASP